MYIGNGRQPETTESARKPANTGLDRQEETNISKELVPGAGIEPARLSAPDFKSGMSTSFIIRACKTTGYSLLLLIINVSRNGFRGAYLARRRQGHR